MAVNETWKEIEVSNYIKLYAEIFLFYSLESIIIYF